MLVSTWHRSQTPRAIQSIMLGWGTCCISLYPCPSFFQAPYTSTRWLLAKGSVAMAWASGKPGGEMVEDRWGRQSHGGCSTSIALNYPGQAAVAARMCQLCGWEILNRKSPWGFLTTALLGEPGAAKTKVIQSLVDAHWVSPWVYSPTRNRHRPTFLELPSLVG